MKPKKLLRKVEVFRSLEVTDPVMANVAKTTDRVHGWWQAVKFTSLKQGDIFRLWDLNKKGQWVPDQKVRGQHAVQVALEDAVILNSNAFAGVKCEPVKGFRRKK